MIEYLFDKSSKKIPNTGEGCKKDNWSRARNSLFNSHAPWKKKLLILCYFKTFIYGRTCTARVQGHVQRCSSTKFNSCTEIITVLSKVRFVGNTVIMVTLTTTTKWEDCPQQKWARSVFLQPIWQHMLASKMLLSRLVISKPKLLNFSKLLCSPVGRTKRINEHWVWRF